MQAIWKTFTSPSISDTNQTFRALPSSWYRSDQLYQLERRAIFSKKWLLATHKARFSETGDWHRFEFAGFPIFLCKDREGHINGFHNACRHRAFPLVLEDGGWSRILSCKYHGWSYGLNGNLAKAPGYQDMEGFDRSQNGLLPIHVHTDHNGFVWINLDGGDKPQIAWSDDLEGVDNQPRFKNFDFAGFEFDHAWSMKGNYNWKTLADNYNECYHCPTTHPDVAGVIDIGTYAVDVKGSQIQHFTNIEDKELQEKLKIASTFFFPNACMTVSEPFMYMMRCVPISSTQCSMEYEVYKHRDAVEAEFQELDAMFKRILSEDKWLCEAVQKNLNAGVFVSGEMHPKMEKGPSFIQENVRKLLYGHREQEQAAGKEIWPARQTISEAAAQSKQDETFCEGLSCHNRGPDVSW